MLKQFRAPPARLAVAASMILISSGAAWACDWKGEPAGYIGWTEPVTGDAEKDTFAFICVPAEGRDHPVTTSATSSGFSAEPVYVSRRTGDEEKDTFGFIWLAH